MRSRVLVVGIVAATACFVAAGAGSAATTNTDPTGDATGGAPDITQVVVSNDVTGVITFRITTVAPITDSSIIGVDLDTDSNPGTGSGGFEYSMIAGTGGFGMLKWDGTAFVKTAAPSLSMTRSGNVVEFTLNRSEIGNVDRFGFDAFSATFDAADAFLGEDDAPDGGAYTYVLALPQCANGKDDDGDGKVDAKDPGCSSPADNLERDDPVTLRASKALTVPAKPKAGKTVVVRATVTRKETGAGIGAGTTRCAARAGTKALSGSGKLGAGVATCRFLLPRSSAGKVVHGTITVAVKGHAIRVPFAFRVS